MGRGKHLEKESLIRNLILLLSVAREKDGLELCRALKISKASVSRLVQHDSDALWTSGTRSNVARV